MTLHEEHAAQFENRAGRTCRSNFAGFEALFRLDCLQQVILFYTLMSLEFKHVLMIWV
jgi:hypothetical protein